MSLLEATKLFRKQAGFWAVSRILSFTSAITEEINQTISHWLIRCYAALEDNFIVIPLAEHYGTYGWFNMSKVR